MRALIVAVAIVVVTASAAPAWAAPKCVLRRLVGLSFGAYNAFSASPLRAAGGFTYRCNGNRDYVLQIHVSQGASNSFLVRQMANGPHRLAYNLFLDAPATRIWGDGSPGTSVYGPIQAPERDDVDVAMFGVIPPRQGVPAGVYADQVVVTLVF